MLEYTKEDLERRTKESLVEIALMYEKKFIDALDTIDDLRAEIMELKNMEVWING